jgi:AcrR family transcriptional regulator
LKTKTRNGSSPSVDEPSSDRGTATLELVLRTSTELFAERGFYGTSMRQLAEQAGMVLSGFYYYFRSKYDVLLAIIDKAVTMMEDEAGQVPSDLAPDLRLRGLLECHLNLHLREPKMAIVADREMGVLKPADLKRMRVRQDRYEQLFRDAIEEGMKTGDFDADIDVAVATKSVLLMATGVVEWWSPKGRLTAAQTSELIADYGLRVVRDSAA